MCKAIVMILLAFVSGSAAARWVKVSTGENNTIYADAATIRKVGNMVKMWTLYDFNAVREDAYGKSFMSSKIEEEYDCENKQMRTVYFSFHSRNMARGKVVYSNPNPDKWHPMLSNLAGESLGKLACGKR